jgi:hypothetical protein
VEETIKGWNIQEDEEQRNERLERKWKWREKDGRSWNKEEN